MIRLLALFTVLLSACTPQMMDDPLAPEGAEAADEYVKPMLPAYETDQEKAAGKSDQFDDFKNANLDIFGVTSAPGVAVRPAAEWETVDALLISYNSGIPNGIKKTSVDIIDRAQDVVNIFVIYESASDKSDLEDHCQAYGVSTDSLQWLNVDNDSIWMRDYGPISILGQGKNAWIDNRYYPNRVYDDAIPTLVANAWGKTVYRAPINMEGGNFMADTDGTCFHTQALYWANATPEANIDQYFADYFGCTNKIVVNPMNNEGTGHIDMQAKIVSDTTILVGEYGDEDPTNKLFLNQNAELLASAGYDIVRIPMPSNADGNFRSYTNSLLVNGVNLWPVYSDNDVAEGQAAAVYEQALPSYAHVPILADTVITWAGAIHCVTMTSTQAQPGALEAAPQVICDKWDCYPGGGEPDPVGCGDITWQGCCDGDDLKYCEDEQVKQSQCDLGTCGWDEEGKFYNCGTDGGEDPSGQNPKDCDGGCQPDCAGKDCGDDSCSGLCGTCPDGFFCDVDVCVEDPCTPDCTDMECGYDSCSGSCGVCTDGASCIEGLCVEPDPDPDPDPEDCPDGTVLSNGDCVPVGPAADDIVDDDEDTDTDGGTCSAAPGTRASAGWLGLLLAGLLLARVRRESGL